MSDRRGGRGWFQTLLVLCLGLAAAESYLRLTIPLELMFDTWFTPGIHVRDETFGFRFAPDYAGEMWHRQGVFGVPIELDEHGFRPTPTRRGAEPIRRVALIGGASMAMGFGLSDDATIAARLAVASQHRLDVRNTAWPGFDVHRNWLVFREAFGDERFDLGVVLLYRVTLESFADVPDDLTSPAPMEQDDPFRLMDGLVVEPPGPIAAVLGRSYYRSFVAHGVLRRLDDGLARGVDRPRPAGLPGAGHDIDPAAAKRGRRSRGRERLAALLAHIERGFAEQGARTLVVFLPMWAPPDVYAPVERALPRGLPRRNLQRQLRRELRVRDTIAAGHYSAPQAERVARRLAVEVDGVLRVP